MKRKINFFRLLLVFLSLQSFSQNEENKWAFTFGSGSVLYSVEDGPVVGGRYIAQFPRLSIATYAFKNITLVGSISTAYQDVQKYTSFDGEIRYDFGSSENTISPYIFLGGGLIDAKNLLPTVNFGAGGTLWFSKRFGLTGQFSYRFNEERFLSQKSHIFSSAGIVYRFSLLSGGSKNSYSSNKKIIRDSKRKRVWDTKN